MASFTQKKSAIPEKLGHLKKKFRNATVAIKYAQHNFF
jgi:hypothetical protein